MAGGETERAGSSSPWRPRRLFAPIYPELGCLAEVSGRIASLPLLSFTIASLQGVLHCLSPSWKETGVIALARAARLCLKFKAGGRPCVAVTVCDPILASKPPKEKPFHLCFSVWKTGRHTEWLYYSGHCGYK